MGSERVIGTALTPKDAIGGPEFRRDLVDHLSMISAATSPRQRVPRPLALPVMGREA
jgi:hypothetical protein